MQPPPCCPAPLPQRTLTLVTVCNFSYQRLQHSLHDLFLADTEPFRHFTAGCPKFVCLEIQV